MPGGGARYASPGHKDTNPKDAAATSRIDLSLIPASALVYAALGLSEGDHKYGGFNWREAGVRWSVYDAAVKRHLLKYADGEEADPTTGIPHLASALAGLAILIDATERGMVTDDRPPPGDAARLIAWAEERVRGVRAALGERKGKRHTR